MIELMFCLWCCVVFRWLLTLYCFVGVVLFFCLVVDSQMFVLLFHCCVVPFLMIAMVQIHDVLSF